MRILNPLADAQATDAARAIFGNLKSEFGLVANIFRCLGHAPEVLQATLDMDRAIRKDLDPKLRELAYIKASRVNHCNYCLFYHTGAGKKAGLTEAQLANLDHYAGSDAYSPLEKAVLRFSEEWTRDGKASAEVVRELSQSLSPSQLVILAATVGLANWSNRFNETFVVSLP